MYFRWTLARKATSLALFRLFAVSNATEDSKGSALTHFRAKQSRAAGRRGAAVSVRDFDHADVDFPSFPHMTLHTRARAREAARFSRCQTGQPDEDMAHYPLCDFTVALHYGKYCPPCVPPETERQARFQESCSQFNHKSTNLIARCNHECSLSEAIRHPAPSGP